MPRKTVNCDGFVKTGNIYFAMLTEKGRRKPLARKCLAFFDRSELDQVPAVGDRTDIVQLGTGHHVSAGEGQRRVALQRRVAAYLVVVGQTPGPRNVASILDSARELGIRDAQVGDVLDILVQPRRNRHAAVRFFRTLLKTQRQVPLRLITDKLHSYSAVCRTVMPSVLHCTDQYANNRAAVSHQPTRQRERQMRRFKSAAQLQRFASVHGIVQNLFRVGRHLLRAAHHRRLRTRAFVEWDAVTCAC